MDYNTLIQNISENWTAIMSTVLVTGGSLWALFSKVTNNKFSHRLGGMESSFSKKADAIGKITFDKLQKFEKIVSSLNTKIDRLETFNKTVTDENLILSNLVVELVALAPIPLSAKEKFYGSLNDMAIVNDKVKQTLDVLIQSQKEQKVIESQKDQDLYNSLDEGA